MRNLNTKIVDEIVKQLPGHKSPVNYLTGMFPMSKETAYRRINNKIPFSIDEVATIADDLNISIDQMLDLKTNKSFPLDKDFNTDLEPADIYIDLLSSDIDIMEKLLVSKNVKITAAINRIPLRFLPYHSLFKFEYYHYVYSTGKISLMTRYSDIVVPPFISDLHKKSAALFRKLDNITCLIDSMIFFDIIRKIQYYYRMKFISSEDLQTLQTELFELLETYETLVRSGKNNMGSNYVFYYSLFNLESNVFFFEYDRDSLLQIWIYPESPIIIKNNRQINGIQKRWIDSKLKNSTLITKTADSQQIDLLRNAYKQIEDLTKMGG